MPNLCPLYQSDTRNLQVYIKSFLTGVLYLIPLEEDAFDFWIFTLVSKSGERKKLKSYNGLLRWPVGQCGRGSPNLYWLAGLAALVSRLSQKAIVGF